MADYFGGLQSQAPIKVVAFQNLAGNLRIQASEPDEQVQLLSELIQSLVVQNQTAQVLETHRIALFAITP